jgi:hypothetical protein
MLDWTCSAIVARPGGTQDQRGTSLLGGDGGLVSKCVGIIFKAALAPLQIATSCTSASIASAAVGDLSVQPDRS